MTTYFARRVLLMIPTLLGISLLVFMLAALAPGGIGASMPQGDGHVDGGNQGLRRAYLEDRYGLRDPLLVQYGRWLARISPLKFGPRDQIDGNGHTITRPRDVTPPLLAGVWYGTSARPTQGERATPDEARTAVLAGLPVAARREAYRLAAAEHARARALLLERETELERALRAYIGRVTPSLALPPPGELRAHHVRGVALDSGSVEGAAVLAAGDRALDAFHAAQRARLDLVAAFDSRPYAQRGVGIIPGLLSLDAPDLGVSFSRGRPVSELIAQALPVTLLLNALAMALIYAVAIPTGILAAARAGTWIDLASGALLVALWSVPVVWAGVMAVGWLASQHALGWFPASGLHHPDAGSMRFMPAMGTGGFERGYLLDTLHHLCLPVACLAYGGFAVLAKQTRGVLLDSLGAPYVRTARAKGVGPAGVLLRHALRNSLLPLITVFAATFPAMLSGSIVVERIFSVPGMGTLLIDALYLRDREVLLASVLMAGVVQVVAMLGADVLAALADPRVTFQRAAAR